MMSEQASGLTKEIEANLDGAMRSFAASFGAMNAFRAESCIHCGLCAEACHFYIATEDPKYTPIWKAEPLKQAYKRESGPFAPFMRWLGLKRAVTVEELREWQHLIYESCNLCGRCSMICPMGIDVAALIRETRRAMGAAGLAPAELRERSEHQVKTGRPEPGDPYVQRLKEIGTEYGVDMPIDLPEAEIFLCIPRMDIEHYPKAVASLIKVINHVGVTATFRSDALIAENYGYYTGNRDHQREINKRLIDEAIACKARTLLVPECRHAYGTLRWEAADLHGTELPFRVRHLTEFLAEQLANGNLKLKKAPPMTVTFHDPCQLRTAASTEHPRRIMKVLGNDLREMKNNGEYAFCCGGGGGVLEQEAAKELRYRTQELRLREADETGADSFVTSCSGCRLSFADAARHFNWDKSPESLLEMVADNLVEE